MDCLDLVNLRKLMALSTGRSEIVFGLIDGPVLMNHPDLRTDRISQIGGRRSAACFVSDSGSN